MQCTAPILLKPSYRFPAGLEVPCGKCLACRKAHAREWAMRICHEVDYWKYSYFITLTYDNEHLPEHGSLRRDHLQKFFKRLRKEIKNEKLKFYGCGEYGSRFLRPHYHIILMANIESIVDSVKNCWQFGLIHFDIVNVYSAQYVAQYQDQKLNGKMAEYVYTDSLRLPPFQCQSQGLGYKYAMDNKAALVSHMEVRTKDVVSSIPRYYKRKLVDSEGLPLISEDQTRIHARQIRLKKKQKLLKLLKKRLKGKSYADRQIIIRDHYSAIRKQREAELEFKASMKSRDV